MWDHMQTFSWGPFGMVLGMLLFWGLVIVVLVALVRTFAGPRSPGGPGGPEKSALDILKERYARGEIGREEYEQMKKDLEQ